MKEHISEATSFLVHEYPYGFTSKTDIRFWIEAGSGSKGFRFCAQTLNPKSQRWNAAKKGTFSKLAMAMFLDASEHVAHASLTEYSDAEQVLTFLQTHGLRGHYAKDFLPYLIGKKIFSAKLASGAIVFTINGEERPQSSEGILRLEKEVLIWASAIETFSSSSGTP